MDERASENCARPDGPGLWLTGDGAVVGVASRHAERLLICLFDDSDNEIARIALAQRDGDLHYGLVPALYAGRKYGLRADGPWGPRHRFDPAKLLVDPMARRIDRPFVFDPALCLPRDHAVDTARLAPKAIAEPALPYLEPAPANAPGLIYEVNVKAHTMRDERTPAHLRGALAGLACPHVIERFLGLGVTHVEFMPIAAWIDERHLPPLGLTNAWGYNPISFMALDPRLAPNGMADLRATVTALRQAGIGVILDVVYNHSGESDAFGPTLSLRGLDNALYYRHTADGGLINDAGCGNSLDCTQPIVVALIVEALRRFVLEAGVEGFRFDLATSLARRADGFDPRAPLLVAIASDPVLRDRVMIAEPWDIGPGGYQVGQFPDGWLEWNDRYRDDVRRFWRGDPYSAGAFATRLAGSSDFFQTGRRGPRESVNFIAAHDGFTLRDVVSYSAKRNFANGEDNRDGNANEICWNGGAEGQNDDATIMARRAGDARALLATLFLSLGTPMLTAGDEFGRTQNGNNNAYAQDNETTWLDWASADATLADFVAGLMRFRDATPALKADRFLSGRAESGAACPDAVWRRADGDPMQDHEWATADFVALTLAPIAREGARAHLAFNRAGVAATMRPPDATDGFQWTLAVDSAVGFVGSIPIDGSHVEVDARAVVALVETRRTC